MSTPGDLEVAHSQTTMRTISVASGSSESLGAALQRVSRQRGGAIAIAADERVSYEALWTRALGLAGQLRHRRVAPGERVVLLCEPGPAAVAAMFGSLTAGTVYVPLDPADPMARLRGLIRHGAASLVLTDRASASIAEPLSDQIPIMNLEDLACDGLSPRAPPDVAPDALAYIMYTSGSTGQPKGVMQTHRNLLHFASVYRDRLAIRSCDRLSLLFSLCFSACNMDIYPALLSGATLCPYDTRRRGLNGLADWIDDQGITVLHTVPSVLRRWLNHVECGRCFKTVRAIDLGGEPLRSSDVELARRHLTDDCEIVNHYAATEASVIAQHACRVGDAQAGGILPVGRAAPGVHLGIERDDGTPANAGEVGRITVRSPFISPGYWQDEERAQLVSSCVDDAEDGRLLRTGDLGRLDDGHTLSVQGRVDSRVKVRGHAVDLLEVEAVMTALPDVEEAAVIAKGRADENAELRLRAFFAGRADPRRVRDELAKHLPRYMVPAEVTSVRALPRNANGKIDRRMLGSLPGQPPSGPFEAVIESPMEREIAGIYQRILQAAVVLPESDFFELGGDSFSAVELVVEIERVCGRRLEIDDVLRDATVRGLAQRVHSARASVASSNMPEVLLALRESGTGLPLFLVHGALGQALISPAFLSAIGDAHPVYAFHARGLRTGRLPHRDIDEMAADYVDAMRSVQPGGPYLIAGICAGGVVAHAMACRLREIDETVAPLILVDPPAVPRRERPWSMRVREYWQLQAARSPLPLPGGRAAVRDILGRLRRRGASGVVPLDPEDSASLRAAVRVAIEFALALGRYRPGAYDGPVFVVGSRKRLDEGWRLGAWSGHFTGDLQLVEVGERHGDVLDPRNQIFAAKVREVLETACAAVTAMAVGEDGPQRFRA